jgi:hypothetical protein
MHVHFEDPEREFRMFIGNGVLGVRNMGGVPEEVFRWRAKAADGSAVAPRIVACGPIVDGPEPTNPPISVSVRTPEDGRRMAHSLKKLGSDCVKVHDGVPRGAYLALVAEAKRLGLPVVGHIPVRLRTRDAVDAGQRSIEHQIGLRGASTVEDRVMREEETNDVFGEAMRTKNFGLIPESIARKGNLLLDHFRQVRADDLYRAFARHRTAVDPTLVTDYALTFIDDVSKGDDSRLKYIPAAQREWWKPENGMLTRYRTPAYIAFRKRQFAWTLEQIPLASRRGVTFLAGTDTTIPFIFPGFSLHDELALFVRAGLSPLEALRTATINPARFLGLDAASGGVVVGGTADLVLLDANPLQDISNTKRIAAVVLRGKLLDRAALDRMLQEAEERARATPPRSRP